jgi:hypothetical protein
MMKTKRLTALIMASLLVHAMPCHADPAQAEDDAYKMAIRYIQKSFAMSPTNSSGLGGAGYTVRLLIPVSKGLDYVILVGGDRASKDIDLYVYDEVGSLILDDRRDDRHAGVQFRSSYSGTVDAYVHIARANGLAAYAVLVGRRGVEREASGAAAPPSGSTAAPNTGAAPGATPSTP